jgi:hypothetical protein
MFDNARKFWDASGGSESEASRALSVQQLPIYDVLQNSVDNNIQQIGFLPHHNGNDNGRETNGNGHSRANGNGNGDVWKCSPKQKELILKIVEENRLDKNEVEALAKDRFNVPVKLLNKLQASQVIKELLEKYPSNNNGGRNQRPFQRAGGR